MVKTIETVVISCMRMVYPICQMRVVEHFGHYIKSKNTDVLNLVTCYIIKELWDLSEAGRSSVFDKS